jgi:hypothetical protein
MRFQCGSTRFIHGGRPKAGSDLDDEDYHPEVAMNAWLPGDGAPGWTGDIWFSDRLEALKARDDYRRRRPNVTWLPDMKPLGVGNSCRQCYSP